MRKKDHSDKVRQRADGHRDNQVRSTQDRTDQCVLLPLVIRGHAHREDVQTHRVSLQQQTHPRRRGRLQRSVWAWGRL